MVKQTEQAGFGAIVGGAVASAVANKLLEKADDEITPADNALPGLDRDDGSSDESLTSEQEAKRERNNRIVLGPDALAVSSITPSPNISSYYKKLEVMTKDGNDVWDDVYFEALLFRSSDLALATSRVYETARECYLGDIRMIALLNLLQVHQNASSPEAKVMSLGTSGLVKAFHVPKGDIPNWKISFENVLTTIFGACPDNMKMGLFGSLDRHISRGSNYSIQPLSKAEEYHSNLAKEDLLDVALHVEALYRAFRNNRVHQNLHTRASKIYRRVTKLEKTADDKLPEFIEIDAIHIEGSEATRFDDKQSDEKFDPEKVGSLHIKYEKLNLHEYMTDAGSAGYVHPSEALLNIEHVTVSEDNEWLYVLDNVNIFIGAGLSPTVYMNTLPYPRGCAIFAIVKHWSEQPSRRLDAHMISSLFSGV